ncbi:MAG: response regulator transcription factor [Devosia sp.]|uniref:response regulator n=1 Tax=Devosia sp. TaxID=1871048 RepID=UPI002639EADB|nr:response regulator transcription factor [Devosia sp.]MDB5542386.1 response regulator transcription factor [Devosia sp.]
MSEEIEATSRLEATIALVDDHPTLLRGLASLFDDEPGFDIVGTGTTASDATLLIETLHPDILITDLSMPGDIFATIETIVARFSTRIVVFTAFANVEMAMRALDAGAHAFVLKGRPSEELYAAIEAVLAGTVFVSPDFAPTLRSGYRHRSREKPAEVRLSAREKQLVSCLLEGKTNKEIARTLQLSEKTIKHYMTNLMHKLRVKNRLEVVLAAQAMKQPQMPLESADISEVLVSGR